MKIIGATKFVAEQENLSFVIRHSIKPGYEARYEDWLKRMVPFAATYPGHRGAHILRPSSGNRQYVIVIRFADLDSARKWIESSDRQKMIAEINDVFIDGDTKEIKSGIDFWFTPESEKRPPGWKQWLVTTVIIAPLTMCLPPFFKLLFNAMPVLGIFGISQIITTSVIVALVTFVIMPRAVRVLRPWLYRD